MFKSSQPTVRQRPGVRAESSQPPADVPAATDVLDRRRPAARRRRVWLLVVLVLALATAGIAVVITDPFAGGRGGQRGVVDNSYPTSLATVTRGTLSSQTEVSGTLGYAAAPDGSAYEVVNQASGTLSKLPDAGQVTDCGQVLYRVSDNPVVLLCGSTPVYRSLHDGNSGPDVRELNQNLVALGYATRSELDPSSDYFGSETAYALERLQEKLGVDQTGSLSEGQAVFLPRPLRITQVTATLGSSAPPGGPVAQATATRRQVTVNLDAAQQSSVKAGDRVMITLPDNRSTPGVVSSVGKVAKSSASGTTIPVLITPLHLGVTGALDQAPVQVQITTASVKDALIVRVDALLALAGGGYAVETVNHQGVHRLVAVTPGLFDDVDGLVQVMSQGLEAGERVAVPAT
jgi:peptidoglycan hydrolase-like protein with peptidoglycan-binding domain